MYLPEGLKAQKPARVVIIPVCPNEWIQGICQKPAIKCTDCSNRDFIPVTDEVIKCHLLGIDSQKKAARDFTIGMYPLLADEICWFLVIDFDNESWMDDAAAFIETCQSYNVPTALERSRSGHGGHVWIFFSEPIKAGLARKLGTFFVTETMERRPEVGLDSYDRFFPSQDTLPQGDWVILSHSRSRKSQEKRVIPCLLINILIPMMTNGHF